MSGKYGIYNRLPEVKDALERLEKSGLKDISKKLIKEFDAENRRRALSQKRRVKLISQMLYVGDVIETQFNKDLSQLDRALMDDFMCVVYENPNIRPYTKHDYYRILKQFIIRHPQFDERILKEHNDGKRRYDKFVFRLKLETLSEKEQIITEEELKKVLSCCSNTRNKAFIALLHESGFRAGEILNIKYKDIRQKGNLLIIKVDGKTGEREIPILTSKPYLTTYLNLFPDPLPNDIIWKKEGNFNWRRRGETIGYGSAVKIVREAFENAGLEHKKFNLHYFRHSRATINAEFMTDAQMCKFFGWVQGSGQAATYINETTLDIENSVLRRHGLEEVENRGSAMGLQTCPTCGFKENMATANYCQRCSSVLSLEKAFEEERRVKEETDKTMRLLMEISKNPEMMSRFEEFRRSAI